MSAGVTMTAERYFLDTGIFITSFSEIDQRARGLARGLIRNGLNRHQAVISQQVIEEFANHALHRFEQQMQVRDMHDYLRIVLGPLLQPLQSVELVQNSLDLSERWRLPFTDAIIVSAAMACKCPLLYTTRAWAGEHFGPLSTQNPFHELG